MASGQAGLPRGVRVPMQRARWAFWETPPESPLEEAKQAIRKSHWELPEEKSSQPGAERWQEAEGGQPSSSQTLLHPCSSCTHASVLVRLVSFPHLVPLQSAPLSPPQTELPGPGIASHPDTSYPGIPAPHPPSVLPRQPRHGAVGMLWALIRRLRAPALWEILRADGHSEGCTGLPVTY